MYSNHGRPPPARCSGRTSDTKSHRTAEACCTGGRSARRPHRDRGGASRSAFRQCRRAAFRSAGAWLPGGESGQFCALRCRCSFVRSFVCAGSSFFVCPFIPAIVNRWAQSCAPGALVILRYHADGAARARARLQQAKTGVVAPSPCHSRMRASLVRWLGRDALLGIPVGPAARSPLQPASTAPFGDIAIACRRCYTSVACVDIRVCPSSTTPCDICLVDTGSSVHSRYASVCARLPAGTTADFGDDACVHGFFQAATLAARVPHPVDVQRVAIVLVSVPDGSSLVAIGGGGGRQMSFTICERHFVSVRDDLHL